MNIKKYRLEYSDKDIEFAKKEVEAALKLGYLTDGGPKVKEFEDKWANFNGSKHAIAVSNCTTGLECILRAINVKDKSVIVPAYTFIASPMAIYNTGGIPAYADINRQTMSLSLESIKKARRIDTKAVMIVHVGGIVSDEIRKIRKYCDDNNLFLIEDAACAHGSSFDDIKAGNFGHASCFSFHHSKVLTSGEGGIITTEDDKLAAKIRRIRAIGLDRSINNYQSFEIGSNSKMSELTAIFAILHTDKAKDIISERQKIANRYDNEINFSNKIKRYKIPSNTTSCYYKYYVWVSNSKVRKSFNDYAKNRGIELPPITYFKLCSDQPISKKMNCVIKYPLRVSRYMTEHHLCLPMYNGLKEKEIDYIIKVLNDFIEVQ